MGALNGTGTGIVVPSAGTGAAIISTGVGGAALILNVDKDKTKTGAPAIPLTDAEKKRGIHSGRIQAQGNGVEKSSSWLQTTPLTRSQGQAVLRDLVSKLTDEERSQRTSAIIKASEYIEAMAAVGGTGPTSKTFLEIKYTQQPSEIECPKNTRIDIEVIRGWAFILP
jgi:hypothetical protein